MQLGITERLVCETQFLPWRGLLRASIATAYPPCAKRRTILIQFLIEAASVCLLGGLIALAIAFPLTLIMQKFIPAALSPLVVSIALLVSLLTGLVSGFLPAWRAARMNVVDALRNE